MATVLQVAKRKGPRRVGLTKNGYTREEEWLVTFDEEVEAEDAILAEGLPEFDEAYSDTSLNIFVKGKLAEDIDDDATRWTVKVSYAPEDVNPGISQTALTALSSFSFDTGSATKRVTQAKTVTDQAHSFNTDSEKDTPLSGGVIGYDGEKAQGVEINVGAFRFTKNRKYSEDEISKAYLVQLSNNTFITNSESYSEWAAFEMLLETVSGRYTPGGSAKSVGDAVGQLGGFDNINGITSDNSDNGTLYVSFFKITGLANYSVKLYKNANKAAADLVASDNLASIKDDNILTEANGSGITGSIAIKKYLYNTEDIAIQFPFPWDFNYNFAISPKALVVAGAIDFDGTEKEGWDYADIRYAPEETTVSGVTYVVEAAKFAYFHKVFDAVDFSFLLLDEDSLLPGS